MVGYIIEAQNKYSLGHEQGGKRPYLVVYESNDYILGFAFTTKAKILYSSHQNIKVNGRSDIMTIDQLQIINKNDFTLPPSNPLPYYEYREIIEIFLNQIIVDNTYDRNKINCPNFCDIIYFIHNIPKIRNIKEWLVLSSNYFNAHSGKCFIIPNDSLDFNYLHSIDWKARQVLIHKKLLYTNNDILNYQETIRKLMIGTKLK